MQSAACAYALIICILSPMAEVVSKFLIEKSAAFLTQVFIQHTKSERKGKNMTLTGGEQDTEERGSIVNHFSAVLLQEDSNHFGRNAIR